MLPVLLVALFSRLLTDLLLLGPGDAVAVDEADEDACTGGDGDSVELNFLVRARTRAQPKLVLLQWKQKYNFNVTLRSDIFVVTRHLMSEARSSVVVVEAAIFDDVP